MNKINGFFDVLFKRVMSGTTFMYEKNEETKIPGNKNRNKNRKKTLIIRIDTLKLL
jgi:hypothetical protein